MGIRNDWTIDEISEIYNLSVMELFYRASDVHRAHNLVGKIQVSSLLSIKTGGCSEDCRYCSQSAYYKTGIDDEPLMSLEDILDYARQAKDRGATRFCMGTAWKAIPDSEMDKVENIIAAVKELNLEVCATMGMVNRDQARRLKEAGLDAYNHNLDTGPDFYKNIVTTHAFSDRLETIANVQAEGIGVCSGGIIGMGEEPADRMALLQSLATLPVHPTSVPINVLVPVNGTDIATEMADPSVTFWDLLRTICTARILMPASFVRLSAGRHTMTQTEQALCFLAGANSIFEGERLLTTPNAEPGKDAALFGILGLSPLEREMMNGEL